MLCNRNLPMSRRLPPLNALRAFEATARCGSFTRAAQELCVTQGAVSRHVASLESWLQVRLIDRSRRGLQLTPPGQAYYLVLSGALDQIDAGTRQLQARPQAPRLRIKLPPTFAIRWLVPRLARFHALHPKVDVQITTSHQRADFLREDVDVSIHSEPGPPAEPGYRRLFGETLVPVCSPGLLEDAPPLASPGDLAQHVLLCSMNRPNDWPVWLAAAGAAEIDGNRGLKFENAALAYQAAADRLGVMVAVQAFVRDDLATGRLVAPLPLRVETPGGYYLTCGGSQLLPEHVQWFESWILREAASEGVVAGAAGDGSGA